jgi:hypothetical protein
MALSLIHTLCSSLQHMLNLLSAVSSPVVVLLPPSLHPRRLEAISHQPPTLTQDSLPIADGPGYIASARRAQKTPLLTALILLRACLLHPLTSKGSTCHDILKALIIGPLKMVRLFWIARLGEM